MSIGGDTISTVTIRMDATTLWSNLVDSNVIQENLIMIRAAAPKYRHRKRLGQVKIRYWVIKSAAIRG